MAKDPAVLFYTSDFLSGTALFSDEQTGQYIKLLCHQHQLGHLPEQHMLNICRTYDNPVFAKFIKDATGLYFNQRMEEEKEKRIKYCNSRRNNKMKQFDEEHMSNHMNKHMSTHMENENRSIIKDKRTTKLLNINTEFEDLWLMYPNKLGKKDALRHYKASVITPEDRENIHKALKNFIEDCKPKEPRYIMHGSRWFNNWRDWVSYGGVKINDVPRKPAENDCVNCRGTGLVYAPGTGKNLPCYCTKVRI